MAVRGAINQDDFEDFLNNIEDKESPIKMFNMKIFKACLIALIQLEIMIFFASLTILDDFIYFDTTFWMRAQMLEILPVINAGFNATTNMKMRNIRNRMVSNNVQIMAKKDTQITAMKEQIGTQNFIIETQQRRLDDQAMLHEALTKASTVAEFEIIKQMLERDLELKTSNDNDLNNEEIIKEEPALDEPEPPVEPMIPPD